MTRLIRGVTLTHPWPWAIVDLGKDVENRSWSALKRGGRVGMLLAIHGGRPPRAGRGRPYRQVRADWEAVVQHIVRGGHLTPAATAALQRALPAPEADPLVLPDAVLMRPGIVTVATLAGVSTNSPSPWAARGRYHWLLADVTPIEPVEDRGPNHQGLWTLEPHVETLVLARYDAARRAA